MHKILMHPDPTPAGGDVPPTTAQLKQLVDAAADGNKAAQAKLDKLAADYSGIADRIAKLEAAAAKAAPTTEEAPPPPPPSKPGLFVFRTGRKDQ